MLAQVAALLGIVATCTVIAAFVARAVAATIWRERAEALTGQVAELRAELQALKEERSDDKRLIRLITAQRDHFQRLVRKLTVRVAELERRLKDAGIPHDSPH